VADVDDPCPDEAEDRDGLADHDGCPEDDYDRDGISDVKDRCPRKPETINGNRDEDGCPDAGKALVRMKGTRMELLERVYFAVGQTELLPRSCQVLDQVASTLKANVQVTLVRVGGHADSTGDEALNRKLSEGRSTAVRDYLISRGVAPERLVVGAFADDRPVASNTRESGRSQNRRVQFTVLEIDGKKLPGVNAGDGAKSGDSSAHSNTPTGAPAATSAPAPADSSKPTP